jgi:hypothetical protein
MVGGSVANTRHDRLGAVIQGKLASTVACSASGRCRIAAEGRAKDENAFIDLRRVWTPAFAGVTFVMSARQPKTSSQRRPGSRHAEGFRCARLFPPAADGFDLEVFLQPVAAPLAAVAGLLVGRMARRSVANTRHDRLEAVIQGQLASLRSRPLPDCRRRDAFIDPQTCPRCRPSRM